MADWDGPTGWTVLGSFDEAVQRIKVFSPYEPKSLERPSIFIPPNETPAALILVYDDAMYGRVWITEELPGVDNDARRREAYEDRVAANGNSDVINTAEIFAIRGSNFGLLRYSEDSATTPTNIEWVENGVQVQILGKSITTEQALELANSI